MTKIDLDKVAREYLDIQDLDSDDVYATYVHTTIAQFKDAARYFFVIGFTFDGKSKLEALLKWKKITGEEC